MTYHMRYDYMAAVLRPVPCGKGSAVSRDFLVEVLGERVVTRMERDAERLGHAKRIVHRRINPAVAVVVLEGAA